MTREDPDHASSHVQYDCAFSSYETLFSAQFEFVYLSIEVTDGDEVYVRVSDPNSYFYVE